METNKIKFGYSIKENLLKLSLNKQGYKNIKNIVNGFKYYKVLVDNSVLTINKNNFNIVHIYKDKTKRSK